jgi:hypothetical protein
MDRLLKVATFCPLIFLSSAVWLVGHHGHEFFDFHSDFRGDFHGDFPGGGFGGSGKF